MYPTLNLKLIKLNGRFKKKAFFLDRDGVLLKTNIKDGKPKAIHHLKDFTILPNVNEAIRILKNNNFLIIVITNQPDVGNQILSKYKALKINKLLMEKIQIDELYVCYHSQTDNCKCRKPKTFFFKKAKKKYNIEMKSSYMIGDRLSDINAGINAGCRTVFIDNNYKEKKPNGQNFNAESLYEAIKQLKLK